MAEQTRPRESAPCHIHTCHAWSLHTCKRLAGTAKPTYPQVRCQRATPQIHCPRFVRLQAAQADLCLRTQAWHRHGHYDGRGNQTTSLARSSFATIDTVFNRSSLAPLAAETESLPHVRAVLERNQRPEARLDRHVAMSSTRRMPYSPIDRPRTSVLAKDGPGMASSQRDLTRDGPRGLIPTARCVHAAYWRGRVCTYNGGHAIAAGPSQPHRGVSCTGPRLGFRGRRIAGRIVVPCGGTAGARRSGRRFPPLPTPSHHHGHALRTGRS